MGRQRRRGVEHHLDSGRIGHFGDDAALGDKAARSCLNRGHHARDGAGHIEAARGAGRARRRRPRPRGARRRLGADGLSMRDFRLTPGHDADVGQVLVPVMSLFGGDGRGLGRVGFSPQTGGLAADHHGQGLPDTDRLSRRHQHALDPPADGGRDGGARVDHRLHPARQPRLDPAAGRDADDGDPRRLSLGLGQGHKAFDRLGGFGVSLFRYGRRCGRTAVGEP
ncbi:hypothetical protein D3C85_1213230 [compost metagenome]